MTHKTDVYDDHPDKARQREKIISGTFHKDADQGELTLLRQTGVRGCALIIYHVRYANDLAWFKVMRPEGVIYAGVKLIINGEIVRHEGGNLSGRTHYDSVGGTTVACNALVELKAKAAHFMRGKGRMQLLRIIRSRLEIVPVSMTEPPYEAE